MRKRSSQIAEEIMRQYYREMKWKQKIKEKEEKKKQNMEEKCIKDTR